MIFLPDLPKPTGLELYSHFAEQLKPILECLAIIAGALAIIKWLRERNNRATDVLLKLEEEFDKKCEKGRGLIEHDWKYNEVKELLKSAVREGKRSARAEHDPQDPQMAVDNLLRFYVVLCGVRQARQLPQKSLSTCYRFWLAHYYRNDRAELRDYVNEFFPTVRKWLLTDCRCWTRFKRRVFSGWWSSFFKPEDFWEPKKFERDPKKLWSGS